MEPFNAEHCTLVLVDYQERLMPSIHDGEQVVAQAQVLAQTAQQLGIRVLGTEQNPKGLGPNLASVRQHCASTVEKMHFDACADGLLDYLAGSRASQVVLAGCEAHVCLMQTAFGLLRAGKRVAVVASACGSRRAQDHALAMRRMARFGIEIVSTEMIIFEWMRHCRHPAFKPVLGLLKTL